MPLFKKKVNNDEPFTPEQLKKLEDKGDIAVDKARNMTIFDRFHARRDSKDIARTVRWKRRAAVTAVISVLVLLILWIIGWLMSTIGDLVISVENGAAQEGIVISEGLNEDGTPNTAHSLNPVPIIVVSDRVAKVENGILADVAPTVLSLMGVPQPKEMEGHSLVTFK